MRVGGEVKGRGAGKGRRCALGGASVVRSKNERSYAGVSCRAISQRG